MARPYSKDLRERVVWAVEEEGLLRRQAAERFGIGIKTAIEWVRRFRETEAWRPSRWEAAGRRRSLGDTGTGSRALPGTSLHPARLGRRAGRGRLAGRLPDGLGLCSRREADL